MIETDVVTAPVYWASALINGDESGFDFSDDEVDRTDYEAFCAWLKEERFSVVNMLEGSERFTNSGHLYFSSYSGCEVCDYVVHRVTGA